MLPDRVSNPGPLTYESGALQIALRGPAFKVDTSVLVQLALVSCFLLYSSACVQASKVNK